MCVENKTDSISSFAEIEELTEPLIHNWVDPNHRGADQRNREERARQQKKMAFRQFSEKVVSPRCSKDLESILTHLGTAQDFIHDRLQTKESFERLEPVLQYLTYTLSMANDFSIAMEYEPEAKEEGATASGQTKFGGADSKAYGYPKAHMRTWTEESDPELLFKLRLQSLDKILGAFQHALKFVPIPILQELEQGGFVEEIRLLREGTRSLLACEAIEWGYGESSKDEQAAVRQTVKDFLGLYELRSAIAQFMASRATAPKDPASKPAYGIVNLSKEGLLNESEEQSPKNQETDPSHSSGSGTGRDKFVWTIQGYVKFVNSATDKEHEYIVALMK